MSKFQQRHYEAIAKVMLDTKPDRGFGTCEAERNRELYQWEDIRDSLRELFAEDNPRFKADKFTKACSST